MPCFCCYLLMLIFSCFFISTGAHAQLAVIDGAALSNSVVNQAANIAKFTAQVDLLTHQLTQMKDEYKSMTGIRGFGDFMKHESFQENLPVNWRSIYERIRSKGYAGLSLEAKKIYDRNKIFSTCNAVKIDEQQLCEEKSVKSAQDQAFALSAMEQSEHRLINIKKLLHEINNTNDPKGIAELQARIAVEQNAISNDQAKFDMFKMISEVEDKILYQRESAYIAKDAAKRGGVDVEPITFD